MNKLLNELARLFSNQKETITPKAPISDQISWKDIESIALHDLVIFSANILDEYDNQDNSLFLVDGNIRFFDNGKSRGFAFSSTFCSKNSELLLPFISYLKERALAKGYVLKKGDVNSYISDRGFLTRYHVYLKPSLKLIHEGLFPQIYGNIEMKFHLRDDVPELFTFMAHTYQDRNYQTADSKHSMYNYFFK